MENQKKEEQSSQISQVNQLPLSSNNSPIPQDIKPTRSAFWVISTLVIVVLAAFFLWYFLLSKPKTEVSTAKLVRIGLSLDTIKIQRWADERDIMIRKAETMNATLTTFSAEGDDTVQISQIENLISQNVDAIIVVAHDASAVAPVIAKAQAAGIKVINYDRLTLNGTPDLYLSFDSVKVGKYAAQ